MNLLVIERGLQPAGFLRELCQGSGHSVCFCRSEAEAATVCGRKDVRFDWVVVNGHSTGARGDLVGRLRELGCRAPVVYLAAGEEEGAERALHPRPDVRRGSNPERLRLNRLDLLRLLTQPGGVYAGEEILFEYHGPHSGTREST